MRLPSMAQACVGVLTLIVPITGVPITRVPITGAPVGTSTTASVPSSHYGPLSPITGAPVGTSTTASVPSSHYGPLSPITGAPVGTLTTTSVLSSTSTGIAPTIIESHYGYLSPITGAPVGTSTTASVSSSTSTSTGIAPTMIESYYGYLSPITGAPVGTSTTASVSSSTSTSTGIAPTMIESHYGHLSPITGAPVGTSTTASVSSSTSTSTGIAPTMIESHYGHQPPMAGADKMESSGTYACLPSYNDVDSALHQRCKRAPTSEEAARMSSLFLSQKRSDDGDIIKDVKHPYRGVSPNHGQGTIPLLVELIGNGFKVADAIQKSTDLVIDFVRNHNTTGVPHHKNQTVTSQPVSANISKRGHGPVMTNNSRSLLPHYNLTALHHENLTGSAGHVLAKLLDTAVGLVQERVATVPNRSHTITNAPHHQNQTLTSQPVSANISKRGHGPVMTNNSRFLLPHYNLTALHHENRTALRRKGPRHQEEDLKNLTFPIWVVNPSSRRLLGPATPLTGAPTTFITARHAAPEPAPTAAAAAPEKNPHGEFKVPPGVEIKPFFLNHGPVKFDNDQNEPINFHRGHVPEKRHSDFVVPEGETLKPFKSAHGPDKFGKEAARERLRKIWEKKVYGPKSKGRTSKFLEKEKLRKMTEEKAHSVKPEGETLKPAHSGHVPVKDNKAADKEQLRKNWEKKVHGSKPEKSWNPFKFGLGRTKVSNEDKERHRQIVKERARRLKGLGPVASDSTSAHVPAHAPAAPAAAPAAPAAPAIVTAAEKDEKREIKPQYFPGAVAAVEENVKREIKPQYIPATVVTEHVAGIATKGIIEALFGGKGD